MSVEIRTLVPGPSVQGDVGRPGLQWGWPRNPLPAPLNLLCSIKQHAGREPTHRGTGMLLGPQLLLTAAHVVDVGQPRRPERDHWRLAQARLYAIHAANAGQSLGSAWATAVACPAQSVPPGDRRDLALVRLETPLPSTAGALFVPPHAFTATAPRLARVAGYPQHPAVEAARSGLNVLEGAGLGRVDAGAPWRLLYEADTHGGHSGGPVFFDDGPVRYAHFVGVHVADQFTSGAAANMGLAFTQEILEWLANVSARLLQDGP